MNIERATLFGRSVKVPLMTQVHREAKLIGHERRMHEDEIRDSIKQLARDPRNFRRVSALRRELLRLYEQY